MKQSVDETGAMMTISVTRRASIDSTVVVYNDRTDSTPHTASLSFVNKPRLFRTLIVNLYVVLLGVPL